jgi:UDP-3-O-[3-hydroxymyristoyl] N-acetylglucosamine deacetylase
VHNLNQKTIKSAINLNGVGLHSGIDVNLKIKPAKPNEGIVFIRTDISENNVVTPSIFNVSSANFCTTISNDFGVSVSTIEHLMGALFILGIDNAVIEIDNQEVPILDGSAKIFVEKIIETGFEVSNQPIRIIKINNKVEFKDGSKFISIEPNNINFEVDFKLEYSNSIIGNQQNSINVYEDDLANIYNSRTFCLYEDIENLKKLGLAKGGSLDNAIVVKQDEVLNKDGLRNDKEFVNHKILDCIGDVFLAGYKIVGKIKCIHGGHKLTNQLLRDVFKDKKNYSIIEIKEKNLPSSFINRSRLKSIA